MIGISHFMLTSHGFHQIDLVKETVVNNLVTSNSCPTYYEASVKVQTGPFQEARYLTIRYVKT